MIWLVDLPSMNSEICKLLASASKHTWALYIPDDCVSLWGPRQWPCRSPVLQTKSSFPLDVSCTPLLRSEKKKGGGKPVFYYWNGTNLLLFLSLCSYFETFVPFAERGPLRSTGRGQSGGWSCCCLHTLSTFLANILLLVTAADNIP